MKSSEYDAYAYLTVTSGTASLADITGYFGIEPDGSSWSKGDTRKVPNTLRPSYEFSRWSLVSGVDKGKPLELHLAALCERMLPLNEKLRGLPTAMRAVIASTGWVNDYQDPIVFRAHTLKEIGMFGIPFDFDLYSEND